jgi:hypothetical protein
VLNTDRIKPECQVEMVLLALLGQQAGDLNTDQDKGSSRKETAKG